MSLKRVLVVCACLSGCLDFDQAYVDRIAALNDAGVDAGVDAGHDAGEHSDGGIPDAGTEDAGETDAGETDAGETDAGETDAGGTDAGGTDAGSPDAGGPDAGVDAGPVCGLTKLEFFSLYVDRDSGVEAYNGASVGPHSLLFAGPKTANSADIRVTSLPDGGSWILANAGGVFSSAGVGDDELFFVGLDTDFTGMVFRTDAGMESAMVGDCAGLKPGAVGTSTEGVAYFCIEPDLRICRWTRSGTSLLFPPTTLSKGACAMVLERDAGVWRAGAADAGAGLSTFGTRGVILPPDGGVLWLPPELISVSAFEVLPGEIVALDHNGAVIASDSASDGGWRRVSVDSFRAIVSPQPGETWLVGPHSQIAHYANGALCTPTVSLPDAGAPFRFLDVRAVGTKLFLLGHLEIPADAGVTRPFVLTLERVTR